MKLFISFLSVIVFSTTVSAQQISIPRIDQMPDIPAPYSIRDWKQVALDYDNYIFDYSKSGTYLPLIRFGTQGQFNYSDVTPVFMDTYVGTKYHGSQAEGINILPAIVGASLVGVNKTDHLGENWVQKAKDFFNKKNEQNVYLNNYITSSGHDWWYDLMPNVYFYQLYDLYPQADPDFETQFITVADRWLNAVYQLGGKTSPWTVPYMNYRAFNLMTGVPLSSGVPEPESAGSIAWLLYHAYQKTGDTKYLDGAKLSLDFLQNWNSNPSYELQLPYGTLVAAKINALENTSYDIYKFTNWCFNRGDLRGWGAIVGKWGDYDVSGLIGEANDKGYDYAFIMNGFQHAAALVPMVKYDKRFANAIGKWVLNLTNASRLFYWNALPEDHQEPQSYSWAKDNDPQACIPYESMKELWNSKQPYAMGDAVKGNWASTNLSLYSGSSVGYLASLIETTNETGILQLDLNITDFFGQNQYPAFLYYNPSDSEKTITLSLPSSGAFDIYDAISEAVLLKNVENNTSIHIESKNSRIIVIYPSGKKVETNGHIRSVDGGIIDYQATKNFTMITPVENSDILIYPNPVRDILNIESQFGTHFISAEILNMNAQVIKSFYAGQENKLAISMSAFDKGIYLVRLKTKDDNTIIKKILVN